MSRLGEILTDPALDPPVAALVVWNCNPLVIVPNAELTRRGLARDDLFTVVHEQFLTDTARYADIVLPATTQIETTDVVPAWGHLWMGWNEAAIAPLGESCSNTELFRRLAGAMGFDEPALFDDDDTLLAQALGDKVDLDELRRVGWLRVPYPDDGRPWGAGVFPTPSGKVELVSDALVAMGQPALPTFVAPREGPHGDAELHARFPLQLLTPKHHTRFLNSGYSHLPKHGPAEGAPFVELDAADAAARGLADGDAARVWNDRATVELPVRITDRLRPGVAVIPFGWWMTQHPDGRVANSLTNDTLTEWGGGVAYSDTLVQIEKPQAGRLRRMAGELIYAFRVMRLPLLDAGGAHDRADPGHRRRARPCRTTAPRVVGLRRREPAAADLRQRQPPRRARQRRRPAAQLGRRPQPVQAAPRRGARSAPTSSTAVGDETVSDVALRAVDDGRGHVVGDRQGPPRPPQHAAPAAELPPRRHRRGARAVPADQRDGRRGGPPARHAPGRGRRRRAGPAARPAPPAGRGDGRRAPRRPARGAARGRAGADRSRASTSTGWSACSTRWSTTTSPTCSARCPASSARASSTRWTTRTPTSCAGCCPTRRAPPAG